MSAPASGNASDVLYTQMFGVEGFHWDTLIVSFGLGMIISVWLFLYARRATSGVPAKTTLTSYLLRAGPARTHAAGRGPAREQPRC